MLLIHLSQVNDLIVFPSGTVDDPRGYVCDCEGKCSAPFSEDDIIAHKLNTTDLSTPELDLVILAKLDAAVTTSCFF